MWRYLACGLGFSLISFSTARADACGGVVSEKSLVVQAQQRVLISLHSDDTSDVVLQLFIPAANERFGALTPVGVQPVLDPDPVDVAELDGLDRATRPIVEEGDSGDGGCSCVPFAGSEAAGDHTKGGVNVVQSVEIGPVTASVLTADSSAPLVQWLGDNGFVLPATDQPLLDAYVGPGQFFIAFKRSSQAPSGPSSVGVSFKAPGDMRGYPLRMSRIGAASRLGIQVFVAAPARVAPNGSAPSAPFVALTLADFAPSKLLVDYEGAVFDEVSKRASKAFVVEGVFRESASWRVGLGPRLTRITSPDQVLTRLASVVAPDTLDRDVTFDSPAPDKVPTHVVAGIEPERGGPRRPATFALIAASALLPIFRRAGSRRSANS